VDIDSFCFGKIAETTERKADSLRQAPMIVWDSIDRSPACNDCVTPLRTALFRSAGAIYNSGINAIVFAHVVLILVPRRFL
jgi:hypothetical protein